MQEVNRWFVLICFGGSIFFIPGPYLRENNIIFVVKVWLANTSYGHSPSLAQWPSTLHTHAESLTEIECSDLVLAPAHKKTTKDICTVVSIVCPASWAIAIDVNDYCDVITMRCELYPYGHGHRGHAFCNSSWGGHCRNSIATSRLLVNSVIIPVIAIMGDTTGSSIKSDYSGAQSE